MAARDGDDPGGLHGTALRLVAVLMVDDVSIMNWVFGLWNDPLHQG